MALTHRLVHAVTVHVLCMGEHRNRHKSEDGETTFHITSNSLHEPIMLIQPRHNFSLRSRNALAITETEEKLIASAAITGESSTPKTGYSTPAAIGTPAVL